MADTIPNLWSDDISVKVLTPLAILRAQAGVLRQITKGILEAEVRIEKISTEVEDEATMTLMHFDLVAPALDRSGYRILTCSYRGDMVYPTNLRSTFVPSTDRYATNMERYIALIGGTYSANGESDLMEAIKTILQSPQTTSLIQSLIARSDEQLSSSVNSSTVDIKS